MGRALEVITGRAVNPGAAPVAATPGTGDSFVVRNAPDAANIWLENLWAQEATAGIVRVRSPRLHDNTQGLRYRIPAGVIRNLWPDEVRQRLYAQDALTVEIAGGAAETDSEALLLHYEDLGGISQRLGTWDQIKPLIVNVFGQEVACVTSATAGDWPAGTLINATFDNFKPDTDYAILGFEVDAACLVVAIRGADTGNLRVGGPAPLEPMETRDTFINLAEAIAAPAIPVINSAGKGSTLVFAVNNAAAANVNVSLIMAELSSGANAIR